MDGRVKWALESADRFVSEAEVRRGKFRPRCEQRFAWCHLFADRVAFAAAAADAASVLPIQSRCASTSARRLKKASHSAAGTPLNLQPGLFSHEIDSEAFGKLPSHSWRYRSPATIFAGIPP